MYTKEELLKKINSLPYWYHAIKLPFNITTPGWAPTDPNSYGIPEDLKGKRVLDIGAWDGHWSFEALERGAKEVVAIDDFSDYLGELENKDRVAWETFDLCRSALGYNEDTCRRYEMSVYELDENDIGIFDTIFFFGVLYHLRYPLLALDKLSSICSGTIHIESLILDDFSPYKGGLNKGYPGNQMVMEFYPEKQCGNNETNWWSPTLVCLAQLVHAAGFKDIKAWKLTENPTGVQYCRGFVSGTK